MLSTAFLAWIRRPGSTAHAPSLRIPQLIEVAGGQELTIVSTAESAVTDNVRFEVKGSTKLVLDVPDLTITGIVDSVSRSLARHRPYLLVLQSDCR